jgi:hypothetical protein
MCCLTCKGTCGSLTSVWRSAIFRPASVIPPVVLRSICRRKRSPTCGMVAVSALARTWTQPLALLPAWFLRFSVARLCVFCACGPLPGGYGLPVDWWMLGTLLYEMLFARTPFEHHDMHVLWSKIQVSLSLSVSGCLSLSLSLSLTQCVCVCVCVCV